MIGETCTARPDQYVKRVYVRILNSTQTPDNSTHQITHKLDQPETWD